MNPLAYILIIISACIHASWNTFTRHLKGNTPVLVIGHFLGALMTLPIVLMEDDFYYSLFHLEDIFVFLAPSILAHAGYMALLASAYVYGDVGLVYPLARGTSIFLSCVVSQALNIDAALNSTEIGGIICVLSGVFGLSLEVILRTSKISKQKYKAIVEQAANNDDEEETLSLTSDKERIETSEAEFLEEDKLAKKKLFLSIFLAVLVGGCTATYSIFDAAGVKILSPLVWSFWINFYSPIVLFPYLYYFHFTKLIFTLQEQKRYIVLMAPAATGAYIIILYTFNLPDISVALVVTLREFSVLIGAVLGVACLKETCSSQKFVSIIFILIGMTLIKLGSSFNDGR